MDPFADSDISNKEASEPLENHPPSSVDVLVIGGGTAGTIAAIQAARAGARTALIERGAQLGGMMTTGGVAWPGLFHAWGRQIIAGIGWDLVKAAVELDQGSLPDFPPQPSHHSKNQVQINQFLYALLAEEWVCQAGVDLGYYQYPTNIEETPDGSWNVTCQGFGMQRQILCRQIVDCTGGATAVGLLNLPRVKGRQRQPGSMLFSLDQPHQPGHKQLDRLYVYGADASNAQTLTAANLEGRKSVLAKLRAEGKRLIHIQPEVSPRETYRILGETVITVDDYTSGRLFEDAIAYAFYPVDLHTDDGVKPQPLDFGVVPTIPLGALIPKGSHNIIVAGRCISSDRLGNSGLRVQASCMAMGQAAGAAAALAAQKHTTPAKVPLPELHALLREHGAIVPEPAHS